MSREAMKLALEALEWNYNTDLDNISACEQWAKMLNETITALRAALAEPEQNPFGDDAERYARKLREERESYKALFTEHKPQTTHWEGCEAVHPECRKPEQEPVASLMTNIQSGDQKIVWNDDGFDRALWHETPLYTAPTPRKPLTKEQIMSIDVLRYHFALNGGAGPISKKGKEIIDAIERAHGIGEQT